MVGLYTRQYLASAIHFMSIVFARQYIAAKDPEFVHDLEANGADPNKVGHVAQPAMTCLCSCVLLVCRAYMSFLCILRSRR